MDGIALFNDAHEYLFTNDAYARITGFQGPGELVGRTFAAIYDEQQLKWIEEVIFPRWEKKAAGAGS
jgi:PAS domain-containing protein